jgi:hypothetical protein
MVQFQTLFKTQLNNYRSADGNQFYSAASRPTIPDEIASRVTGVIGLTNGAHTAALAKPYKVLGENAASPTKDVAVYITKGTSLEIKGLIPNDPNYSAPSGPITPAASRILLISYSRRRSNPVAVNA